MSSNEDEYNDGDTSSGPLQTAKKRRIRRACDICRRKKIRCDGVQMPENRCTNCITCNTDCTYVEAAKKRGPPKGYVESLEIRVEKLEKLLRHLCPDEALFKALQEYLDGNWTIDRPTVGDIAKEAEENPETVASAIRGAIETNSNTTGSDPHDPTLILIEKLREMKFAPPHNSHFLGKSSGGMLLHTAIELKSEYTGEGGMFENLRKSRPKIQRAEFWDTKPWERKADATASPKYDFPDVDLALHCIDLYFKINNLYLPLLHRPTFDKLVKERLYDTDEGFAAVFLLVCAVGARQSDDPRVLVDGMDTHSAGWKWFEQVRIMKRSLLSMPTLYDLQLYCLCAQYLVGATAAHAAWTLAGIGLRLAQDIGAHRRKEHGHIHTPEDELFKRAFWALLAIERKACAVMGRSCSIHDEDFDLDWPADCDDEYWDNPDREKRFKQPPNKPSSLTSFILYLKLLQILAFALRTIHSINKPKILLGFVGQAWEQHVVAELDSALNKWVDSVPDHLRWDPNREDNSFFNQSVFLYSTYYLIQMTIHRPFIPTPTKPSPLPFPSLAICTNAARSCCHLVDVQRQRNPHLSNDIMMPTFNAGTVLLMSMWGGKRVGLSSDPKKEMADVDKCMAVLKAMEARWYYAGRLRDVLYSLACDGNLPLSQPSPPSMKRERDWEASANESSLSSMSQNEVPRVIVSSRRVPAETSVIGQTQQPQRQYQQPQAAPPPLEMRSPQFNIPPSQQVPPHSQIEQNPESTSTISPFIDDDPPVFSLPVYSNELGSFPMHGYVNFSAQAHHPRPQTHQPQLDPQTNHWYAMSDNVSTQGGEPTPHGGPSGASSSYWSQHQPVPAPQHQHYQQLVHPNHVSQSIRSSGFSMSETSSTTHGPYGMDPAQIATGTMHDSGTGTLPYAQQRIPIYRLGSTDTPSPSVGSSSTMSSSQSSPGSSIENVYGGMRMDTRPNLSDGQSFHQHQHQHQGVPPQQEQLHPLTDPFGDGDTVDLWSNAPTELDDWGISELLMQGHGHSHPST